MCEVALNNCEDAAWTGILEYTNTLQISTDEGGYAVRAFAGTLTIAATRVAVAGAAIPDTADNYFDRVCPATLAGFKRSISRILNEAKDKLQFTVTDTEQAGNPLPEGVVAASASHEVNSAQGSKAIFLAWTGTVSAEYEMQRGKSRGDGFGLFMKLLKDRVDGDRQAHGFFYMPLSMKMGEPEIYGRRSSAFSMTYSLLPKPGGGGAAAAKNMVPVGGLWRRTGGDWNKWAASVPLAQANRGLAGLRHRTDGDAIVDLCLGAGRPLKFNGDPPVAVKGWQEFGGDDSTWGRIASTLGVPSEIDPLGSWQLYECRLVVEPVDRNVIHKPLPVSQSGPGPFAVGPAATSLEALFSSPRTSFYAAPQYSPPAIIQADGSTDFYVRLVGRAVRVGHEIPPPQLLGVSGGAAVPMNHPDAGTFFSTWTAGYTTHPIQAAEWNLRWFLQLPQGIAGINVRSQPRPDEPGNIYQGTVR